MKKALTIILLFLFPAVASFLLLLMFRSTFQLAGLIENTLFSFLFILLSILINSKKRRSIFLCFGYILNSIIILCETAYFYLYGYNISGSTIYILMETHKAEASEFLSMFFDKNIFLFIFIYLAPIYFICRYIFKWEKALKFENKRNFARKNILISGIMLFIMFVIAFSDLKYQSLPLTTFKSLYTYRKTIVKLDRLNKNKEGGLFTNVHIINSSEKATYVIIIGESSTRDHFGLYGYYRQTNPLLNEIKDELIIYRNVIAPHTTTIQVLIKALTPGNYENPRKIYDGTLMQLMNRAGFKTYWISNQKPFGAYESITSKLSKTASERIFLNSPSVKSTLAFDEDLVEPLNKALSDTTGKKLIVVHLLGAHAEYEKRYPDRFEIFTGKPQTVFNNDNAYWIINEYDNAIAYNDFVIRQMIEEVRKTAVKAYVLYFSDHGEDVFETKNMAFHSESEGTKPMYDIPFFVWLSNDLKQNLSENLIFDVNRKYMTDDLIFSIANISDVVYDEYDSGRSIFDKKFKYRKRRIYYNIDYDLLFPD